MAISMLKIRRPLGRLIFNMGIAIPDFGKLVADEYRLIMDRVDARPLPDSELAERLDTLRTADDPDGVTKKLLISRPRTTSQVGEDYVYNMCHARRGMALIINNKNFRRQTGMGDREGTDVDAGNLDRTFSGLGFTVRRCDNITCAEMSMEMKKVGRADHHDADCFVLIILSHGDEEGIYGTDGVMSPDQLIEPIKGNRCPDLTGKPKLIFIQACRGNILDSGATIEEGEDDEIDAIPVSRVIPHEADVMIACSSVPGYYSWRNRQNGSWFIQAVCTVFDQYGLTLELMQLMTRVNYLVAQFLSSSNVPQLSNKKQIPDVTTRLTKEVFFAPNQRTVRKDVGFDETDVPSQLPHSQVVLDQD